MALSSRTRCRVAPGEVPGQDPGTGSVECIPPSRIRSASVPPSEAPTSRPAEHRSADRGRLLELSGRALDLSRRYTRDTDDGTG